MKYPQSLLLIASLTASACRGDVDATPVGDNTIAPVSVSVATVTSGSAAQPVVATGIFGPRDEIPLAFKIGGVIDRVLVDAGASVLKGQVLASLDLREIDAMVGKARAGLERAERDASRVARLAADSVATRVQALDAASALNAARADYTTARVNREYATILAPESGIVLTRTANAGSTVAPGTPVLTIGGSARGRVLRVGIPDRDAMRVRVGDSATAHFGAAPAAIFRGTVTLLGKSADARTGTYAVEITLRDVSSLPAGLVGRAEIAVRATTTAAQLPVDALLEADADSALVYTVGAVEPLIAQPRRVKITQLMGDYVAVAGLEHGSRVITRGAPYVTAGARVRIAPATVTPATTRGGGQ